MGLEFYHKSYDGLNTQESCVRSKDERVPAPLLSGTLPFAFFRLKVGVEEDREDMLRKKIFDQCSEGEEEPKRKRRKLFRRRKNLMFSRSPHPPALPR